MQYIFIDHEKSWTRISHDSTAHGKSRRKWCRVLRQPRDPSRISVVHHIIYCFGLSKYIVSIKTKMTKNLNGGSTTVHVFSLYYFL